MNMEETYFKKFQRGYWDYYIELEARIVATKRYVEFDFDNKNTYSSTYLILMQTVCSEIDTVGKAIAAYYSKDFNNDKGQKSIKRWWFEIQDKLPDVFRRVSFAGSFDRNPWDKFKVEKTVGQTVDQNGQAKDKVTYDLKKDDGVVYYIPEWWSAYNKVKHHRLDLDSDRINYKKANLDNLTNAVAGLYLLEFEFMKYIGNIEERVSCTRSVLFGMGDIDKAYINSAVEDEKDQETLVFK